MSKLLPNTSVTRSSANRGSASPVRVVSNHRTYITGPHPNTVYIIAVLNNHIKYITGPLPTIAFHNNYTSNTSTNTKHATTNTNDANNANNNTSRNNTTNNSINTMILLLLLLIIIIMMEMIMMMIIIVIVIVVSMGIPGTLAHASSCLIGGDFLLFVLMLDVYCVLCVL